MELIDKDKLLSDIDLEDEGPYLEVKDIIDAIFLAEPEKGKWIPFSPEMEINDVFKCSVCSEFIQLVWRKRECPYNYCPYCGVRMKGD